MAEKHTASERLQLFRRGWVCGAASRAMPEGFADDSDFLAGYKKGRTDLGAAMALARVFYDAPPPSILRTQSVTPTAVDEFLQDPRTGANMKKGSDE